MSRPQTANRTAEPDQTDGVLRRTVLKATAVAVGTLGTSVPVAARRMGPDGEPIAEREIGYLRDPDESVDFGIDLLAGPATFTDDVTARFRTKYDGGSGAIVSNLPQDASNVFVARVTWKPGGTSGWHTHPGPVIVSVTEGEVAVTNERDCLVRTYAAGEAFLDPGQGNVHIASNPSETDDAVAYATFLGVPDGARPTQLVPPVECSPNDDDDAPARAQPQRRSGIV